MDVLRNIAVFAFNDLGPLIVWWGLLWTFDLKTAIAGVVLFVLFDAGRRWWTGMGYDRLWLFVSGLTVVFGIVDLFSQTPFMLKYEAVFTNLATAALFCVGLRSAKPMLMELAEKREGEPFPPQPDIRRFFQYFTLLWVGYFVVKSLFYLWIGWTMDMVEAAEVRTVVGTGSMLVMVGISSQGRRLFDFAKKRGWLPDDVPDAQGAALDPLEPEIPKGSRGSAPIR